MTIEISLRDYFAAHAPQIIFYNPNTFKNEEEFFEKVVEYNYIYADKMLKIEKKKILSRKIADCCFDESNFNNHIIKHLHEANIYTVEELSSFPFYKLKEKKGLGTKSINLIYDFLNTIELWH